MALWPAFAPAAAVREPGPVALTTCETSALRQRLGDDDARRLYAPVAALARRALSEPPRPVPRIFNVPETDPRFIYYQRLYDDATRIQALGYAYVAEGEPLYAERAAIYLEAWADMYRPDGHPIDENETARLVRGYSLVAQTFPSGLRSKVDAWLDRIASVQLENRLSPIAAVNNWQSHRLKIVGYIGYFLRDSRFVRYAEDGYRKQIAENLRPDGTSFDFHHRDALTYHVWNLSALLELAIAADKNGLDLYSYQARSGSSLEKSITFLLPYVRGEKIHHEFVRTQVEGDRQRFSVGAPFDPRRAAWLLEMAGYFNPTFANEPVRGEPSGLREPFANQPVRGEAFRSFQTVLNGLREVCGRK